MPHPSPTNPPPQAELPLDHAPALEQRMRAVFERQWRRWHPARTYEDAVADPLTHRLLVLTVQHQPAPPTPRKPRCKR